MSSEPGALTSPLLFGTSTGDGFPKNHDEIQNTNSGISSQPR
jgi:hypothetical protein